MTQKQMAAAIRAKLIAVIRNTEDEDVIRNYLRCPDCGEAQHSFDPEEVYQMVDDADSPDSFAAIYDAACDAREQSMN
jgi:uncharacterized protein with PIN domain